MKKNFLIFIMLLTIVGFSRAQVVSSFEVIKMNLMLNDTADHSFMSVVPNPDPTGIDTSKWVVKFLRDKDGWPWDGFFSTLLKQVDVTVNKYVHVKVWKPIISPIKFKLQDGAAGTLEIFSMTPQATTGAWEDMVFDFSSKTGTYPTIVFMPDFEDPVTLTNDIVIYFDDIMVNNDPTPNSAAVNVIENYEIIPMNLMLNDPLTDLSYMNLVPNPNPSGINQSNYVVKFLRDKDGWPWDGFWSPTAVDVTTNKYMHVKVWKPRISPIKFKIQGGAAGDLETFSTAPQDSIGAWEDMVFDFTSKTGAYPTITFMPDFEDPVTLTEDMVMYFDDIILNNNPNAMLQVIMRVNMKGAGLTSGQPVFISGDFGGIYGSWDQPGTNANNQMTGPDADSIYSLTMGLSTGNYNFKFFKGTGWAGGEWDGNPNRLVSITGAGTHTYKWNVKPAMATFNVDMKGSGLTTGPVSIAGDFGGIYGTWSMPGTNVNDSMAAALPLADSIYTITMNLDSVGMYQFKFFKGQGWATGEWDGVPNRTVTITKDTTFATFIFGQKPLGIGENPLEKDVNVYPVPFNTTLIVKSAVDLKSVILTSAMGQQVLKMENTGKGTITANTSEIAPGLYFITFYPKSGNPYTLKIMKY